MTQYTSEKLRLATYSNGATGKGIQKIENFYYAATSEDITKIPATAANDWKTKIEDLPDGKKFDETNKYLWNFERITYTEGSPVDTDRVMIAVYSKDGRGIKNVTEFYITSKEMPTNLPTISNKGDWTKEGDGALPIPDAQAPYLWNYEIVEYTSGANTSSGPVCIGSYGNSITSVTEWYKATNTSEAPKEANGETGNWVTDIKDAGQGAAKPYLWNYEETTYSIGNPFITPITLLTSSPREVVEIVEYYQQLPSTSGAPDGVIWKEGDDNHNQEPTPSTGWDTAQGNLTPGNVMWNMEVIKYAAVDGEGKNLYTATTPAQVGYAGRNGISFVGIVEYYYATSNKDATVTWDSVTWSSTPSEAGYNSINKYLWNYEEVKSDSTISSEQSKKTSPEIIAVWGTDGAEGRYPKNFISYYTAKSSPTDYTGAPTLGTNANSINDANTTWTKNFTNVALQKGQYLLEKMFIEYDRKDKDNKNLYKETAPVVIGSLGTDGDSPYIENGKWYIGTNTNKKELGQATGDPGDTPYINDDGYWVIGNTTTTTKAEGIDGVSFTGIEEYYYTTTAAELTNADKNATWTTTIPSVYGTVEPATGKMYKYLWNKEKVISNNNGTETEKYSDPVLHAIYDGDRVIVEYINYYAAGASITAPSGGPALGTDNNSITPPTNSIWKQASAFTGSADANDYLFEASFVKYAAKDKDGKNLYGYIGTTIAGHNGANGTSPYTISLDEDFCSILADHEGNIDSDWTTIISPTAFYGYTEQTWTNNATTGLGIFATGTNLTVSYNNSNKKYVVSNLTDSVGSVEFILKKDNVKVAEAKFEAVKQISGAPGEYIYAISSPNTINASKPENISVKLYQRRGAGEPNQYTEQFYGFLSIRESGETETYSSTNGEIVIELSDADFNSGEANQVHTMYFDIYADQNKEILLDKLTFEILRDGVNGETAYYIYHDKANSFPVAPTELDYTKIPDVKSEDCDGWYRVQTGGSVYSSHKIATSATQSNVEWGPVIRMSGVATTYDDLWAALDEKSNADSTYGGIFTIEDGNDKYIGINADLIKTGALCVGNQPIFTNGTISNWNNNVLYASFTTLEGNQLPIVGLAGWEVNGTSIHKSYTVNEKWCESWLSSTNNYTLALGATTAGEGSTAPFSVKKDGTVYATRGNVGGWILSKAALYKPHTATIEGVEKKVYTGFKIPSSSTHLKDKVLFLGATDDKGSNAPFYVRADGAIYSTSGQFGGWTLTSTGIKAGYTSDGTTRYVGLNRPSTVTKDTVAFYAGANVEAQGGAFQVTYDGTIKATKGIIANWTIASNRLYYPANGTSASPIYGVGVQPGGINTSAVFWAGFLDSDEGGPCPTGTNTSYPDAFHNYWSDLETDEGNANKTRWRDHTKFFVQRNGYLKASYGKIGPWELTENGFQYAKTFSLAPSFGFLTASSTVSTEDDQGTEWYVMNGNGISYNDIKKANTYNTSKIKLTAKGYIECQGSFKYINISKTVNITDSNGLIELFNSNGATDLGWEIFGDRQAALGGYISMKVNIHWDLSGNNLILKPNVSYSIITTYVDDWELSQTSDRDIDVNVDYSQLTINVEFSQQGASLTNSTAKFSSIDFNYFGTAAKFKVGTRDKHPSIVINPYDNERVSLDFEEKTFVYVKQLYLYDSGKKKHFKVSLNNGKIAIE